MHRIDSPSRKRICNPWLCIGIALVTIPSLRAQDAAFIAIVKSQNFEQFGPLTVGLKDEDFFDTYEAPFVFDAFVAPDDFGLVTGATLSAPGGASSPLLLDEDEWVLARGFESFHSLEESFASGNYELEVNTLNDGSPTVSLDLPATGYPAVTTFTVFEEAQMIDSDEAFVFEWEPIPGGTEDDLVFFEIEDQSGNYVFESPGLFEDGQLTGESTRITVPAGTLNPGEHYYGFLLVARLVDQDEDGYPGVFTVSALEKAVEMPIRTSGGTDSFAPGFITSAPSPGASGVERNSVVTFSFDEPMDTAVEPGQAINWQGVNPADLRYSWSPDGRRLFCRPDAGLPPSTMVTWTLNPSGSATKLRDESGNPLPDEQWGDFTTGDDSNIGDPDVLRFEIGKGRGFIQDGPTATDMGSYFAGFFADLSGVATVSSIDLEIPGRGLAPDVGELVFDGREIESEVAFAEAGDLGRIFPEGDYTVTFHTAHDGNQDVTLTFGEDAYPNAPTLRNFASTQALDSLQPITLEWDPMNGGTEADYIELYVEGDFACYFESPAPGEPGALDGRSTSITIPAETLPPGRTLDCELVFARVSDTNTDDYPGLEAAAGFFSITEFQIRTIGDPFTPQLKVTHDQGIAFVTVTAEIGSYYELRASDDLQNWSPVWGGYLWDDCDGYKGTLEFAEDVSGMPARFYQLFEIDFGD